jgi:hypothetical protein
MDRPTFRVGEKLAPTLLFLVIFAFRGFYFGIQVGFTGRIHVCKRLRPVAD